MHHNDQMTELVQRAPALPGAAARPRVLLPRRALAAAATVVLAAAGAAGFRTLTGPLDVPVARAASGSVREETTGPGTVQARRSVSVGVRVAGTIDRVLADVGDEVQAGQLLATLDRTESAARFRATQGALESARFEVALAKANLDKAIGDLAFARRREDRTRPLADGGFLSVEEADDARAAVISAEVAEDAARAALGAREAAVIRSADERRVAEVILSYAQVESPMSGVITRRAIEPGSAVPAGGVVFHLVDPETLWVATLVDQALVGRIRIGQAAVIRLRSGMELPGHVARIAYEADPVTRELEVDVAFDERPARFAIHEDAAVTILGEETAGLAIPLDAVTHSPEGARVFVVDGGRARARPVVLGAAGSTHALIAKGLAEGDVVILSPGAVREGLRVEGAGGDG